MNRYGYTHVHYLSYDYTSRHDTFRQNEDGYIWTCVDVKNPRRQSPIEWLPWSWYRTSL